MCPAKWKHDVYISLRSNNLICNTFHLHNLQNTVSKKSDHILGGKCKISNPGLDAVQSWDKEEGFVGEEFDTQISLFHSSAAFPKANTFQNPACLKEKR